MINPHLAVNLEARTENINRGQYVYVDIDMTVLTAFGWERAYFDIYFDRTKLELVPYSNVPMRWVGFNMEDEWFLMGGNIPVITNHSTLGRPARIRLSDSSFMIPNTSTVYVTLRFRVLNNASIGETLIKWAPFGAAVWHPINNQAETLYFAPPTLGSFARVMINN